MNTNAAFEYARTVDLVEWLVENPTSRDQLDALVHLLVSTSDELLAAAPKGQQAAYEKRILDHLWCDLVASVVNAIEIVGKLESVAKGSLAEAVAQVAVKLLADARVAEQGKPAGKSKNGEAKRRAELDAEAGFPIESAILEGCVRRVTKIALDGATGALDTNLKIILLKLRIAALMLCPDVMAHELVFKHCWLPMWNDAVFDAALEELAGLVEGLNPSRHLVDVGSAVQ